MRTVEDTCQVLCVDNGNTMQADVLNFRPLEYLSVAIRTIKVGLRYNADTRIYEGNMGRLTLTSTGPKITEYKTGR